MASASEVQGKQQERFAQQLQDIQAQLEKLGADEADIGISAEFGAPVIKSFRVRSKEAIKSVAQADPSNIQEVAASQLEISNSYYQSVLAQARQSFKAALIAGSIGLAFFVAAIGFVVAKSQLNAAIISSISGGIVEVIAGLNFWLYGRTAAQLDAFHVRLEQTQRFLLSNSVCQTIDGQEQSVVRSELVKLIATQTVSPNATSSE